MTQPIPETSDPTSARRTAVYPPSRNVGDSPTNENSPFQIGLESSRIPGLYKPAVPDQQQDTLTRHLRARSSGSGPSSPTRTLGARSSGSGPGAGIVYPLQPRGRRPDTHIIVDVGLPEPAAFQRQIQPPTVVDQDPPHLPEPLEREAQDPDQGQELCIHFSRVGDALIHTSLWMSAFLSQPPSNARSSQE